MAISDNEVKEYRALIAKVQGRELDLAEAREELTRVRLLWWMLGHRPPAPGEERHDPPPPSWL